MRWSRTSARGSWQAPLAEQPSWLDLIVSATPRLLSRREAQWIAEQASGGDLDAAPPKVAAAHFELMVTRRAAGEPLQYVLGSWSFRRLDLWVDGRVLIPRPETEQVVERALTAARSLIDSGRVLRIADLGTGSGSDRAVARARAAVGPRRDLGNRRVGRCARGREGEPRRAGPQGRGRACRAGGVVRRASGRRSGRVRPHRLEPAVRSGRRGASSGCRAVGARECALRGTDRPRGDRAHRARGRALARGRTASWSSRSARPRATRSPRSPGLRASPTSPSTKTSPRRDRILTASRHL